MPIAGWHSSAYILRILVVEYILQATREPGWYKTNDSNTWNFLYWYDVFRYFNITFNRKSICWHLRLHSCTVFNTSIYMHREKGRGCSVASISWEVPSAIQDILAIINSQSMSRMGKSNTASRTEQKALWESAVRRNTVKGTLKASNVTLELLVSTVGFPAYPFTHSGFTAIVSDFSCWEQWTPDLVASG